MRRHYVIPKMKQGMEEVDGLDLCCTELREPCHPFIPFDRAYSVKLFSFFRHPFPLLALPEGVPLSGSTHTPHVYRFTKVGVACICEQHTPHVGSWKSVEHASASVLTLIALLIFLSVTEPQICIRSSHHT